MKKTWKLLLRLGSMVAMITPITVAISCGSKAIPSKEQQRNIFLKQKDNILWKETLSKQDIEEEDRELALKYQQYTVAKALDLYDPESYQNDDSSYNKVLLFLDGGPRFFLDPTTLDEKGSELLPGYTSENDHILSSEATRSGVRDNFIFANIQKYVHLSAINETESSIKETKYKNIKPRLYNFIESQNYLTNDAFTRVYSYQHMLDAQKMTLINLHKAIKSFKDNGKKVYLWGSSFGAMTLYGYLARYGNDSDGMIAFGGPINYGSFMYSPNSPQKSIKNIKKNLSTENIYKLPHWNDGAKELILEHEVREAKLKQMKNFVIANRITLLRATNNLSNTETIAKLKLDNKVTISYGDDDWFFSKSTIFPEYKAFYEYIQDWTWSNMEKSGANILVLKGARHTSQFIYGMLSQYLVTQMILDDKVSNIDTFEKYMDFKQKYDNLSY
ncbi:hypothetical protein [Candidatus Mycoplasma mahonii]|uniref:hypothetical protein n=1 Tax=Candidatus Mycoplasma mahonii TaxID=3004105 RepID=UPI0026ECBC9C|nr:hypothetical protein [Candidatus Mycoplasma mahonii]WKX02402.1 hypothetical protein O3I44_03345 [Candidatus Mycoplasma mahonii]